MLTFLRVRLWFNNEVLESGVVCVHHQLADNVIWKIVEINKESVGLKIDPWGTPVLMCFVEDFWPSKTTDICRPLRKEVRSWWSGPVMPWERSLWRLWCQDLSSALEISRATDRFSSCLSRTRLMCWARYDVGEESEWRKSYIHVYCMLDRRCWDSRKLISCSWAVRRFCLRLGKDW